MSNRKVTTYCSGLGRRWAERRLEVVGSCGASYLASTLWICVDATSGRPQPLSQQFLDLFAPAAQGRRVSARLTHPSPPADASRWAWPLRAVDFDTLGHVNNAAYWAVVEELYRTEPPPDRLLASIEYRVGLPAGAEVTVAEQRSEGGRNLWLLTGADEEIAATIALEGPGV